jgi:small subunit ribosomal protein S9
MIEVMNMAEKKERYEKKERAEPKESRPKQEKVRVKQLIEERMEKIRKQELVKEGSESAEKAKPSAPKAKVKPLPTSVFVTGKRKRAIARAFFKLGKGVIKVNSVPIELLQPDMFRLKMMEPLMIIGDGWRSFDARITVRGGGPSGQADAVRQVIARALSELLGPEARKAFLSYDRNLIVYDSRRTEPHKPPHSSWGPRRYKQRSKR